MKTRRSWLHLALPMVLRFQTMAKCFSVEKVNMMISNTTTSINVIWENPDKSVNDQCYRTHVQHRHQCDPYWKNVTDISGFSFQLPAPDMKKNYVFRLRMRLYCINREWSKWSPEKFWKNDTDLCINKTTIRVWNYLLINVLSMGGILLLIITAQTWVRRVVLPIIPDPMHTQETILNVEQFQFWSRFPSECEECKITEIQVVCEMVNEETDITQCGSQEPPQQIHSTDTTIGNHEHDHDLPANSVGPSSPVPPEDTKALLCSQAVTGYVVLLGVDVIELNGAHSTVLYNT